MRNIRGKHLLIVGASGHGRVIADLASNSLGYNRIEFLDDDKDLQENGRVLGGSSYAIEHREEWDVIVAIGNAAIRQRIQEKYEAEGVNVVTLIHPFSYVASDVLIGSGSVIMAGAVVQTGTKLGKGVIVNTSSSIDHDNEIGDYCHIAVGSHLAGNVKIGNGTWIGAGATVSNNILIGENVLVGAGAVIIENINIPGTYVGVPAKKIK